MKFKEYNPHQMLLLPSSLEEIIPQNHIVRGVEIIIEQFDLKKLYDSYSEEGQPGYHAKMLLKVLLYAYVIGMRSSRKIAAALESDIFFMYLAAMQRPDFRTISDFRKNKGEFIWEYFKELTQICKRMGLIKLKHVAFDGSKIEANASRRRMKEKDDLMKLEEKIERILKEAEAVDKEEDKKFGKEKRGDELPDDLKDKKKFLEKLKEAKKYLEDNQLKRVNITDPGTRLMRTPDGGKDICYNAQVAVDSEHQIIVANDVVSDEADNDQFIPMYEAVKNNMGEEPKESSADAGYQSGKVYLYLENNGIDGYIPDSKLRSETDEDGKEIIGEYDRRKFKYKKKRNNYICPQGKELKFQNNSSRNGVKFKVYQGIDCKRCKKARECITKGDAEHRQIQIYENDKFKAEMRAKLLSDEGRKIYNKRMYTVEPVFAHIKRLMGVRQFLLRGKEKAKLEFNLICTAYNLKKLITYGNIIPV